MSESSLPYSLANQVESNYYNLKRQMLVCLHARRFDQALLFADLASKLSFFVPFGVWQDDELEDWLAQFLPQMEITPIRSTFQPSGARKRVLHLVPKLFAGGGYRMALIANVRALAADFDQIVLNTASSTSELDCGFVDALRETGAQVVHCRLTGYLDHAEQVASAIQSACTDVILNYATTAPSDFLAMAWTKENLHIPVIRFNYGDSYPILGKRHADVWVEMRELGAEFSRRFRQIASPVVLPLPVPERNSRSTSRLELGIPEDATVSLTISPYWKLIGDSQCDYFKGVLDLLDTRPAHHHLLVSPDLPLSVLENIQAHRAGARFHVLGYRSDLDALMRVSDVAIEGFPLIGATVRLELVAARMPLLAWQNSAFSGFGDTDEVPPNYPFAVSTIQDWSIKARQLIDTPAVREYAVQWLDDNAKKTITVDAYKRDLLAMVESAIQRNFAEVFATFPSQRWTHPIRYDVEYVCAQGLASHPTLGKSQFDLATQIGQPLTLTERWRIWTSMLALFRLSHPNNRTSNKQKTEMIFWFYSFVWLTLGSEPYTKFIRKIPSLKAKWFARLSRKVYDKHRCRCLI